MPNIKEVSHPEPGRKVVKEITYPHTYMSEGLVDQWNRISLPYLSEKRLWESEGTPMRELLLPSGGKVFVKDESDRTYNPTGTMKDRLARSLTSYYVFVIGPSGNLNYLNPNKFGAAYPPQHALMDYWEAFEDTPLKEILVPRLSVITSGNEGLALARCFEEYNLPPPKLLMDENIKPEILNFLKKERADIYLTGLSRKLLTSKEILTLTNNEGGVDATLSIGDATSYEYQRLVAEVFGYNPEMIFMPYGSGRLFNNFVDAQTVGSPIGGGFREYLPERHIVGMRPVSSDSKADKLTSPFDPYEEYYRKKFASYRERPDIGSDTGIYAIEERYIEQAQKLLTEQNIDAEFSGAAGLAGVLLWEDREKESGLHKSDFISRQMTVVVVNTGKGLMAA